MASYDTGLAGGYVLRLTQDEVGTNAAGNYSIVRWSLQIIKGPGSGKYAGGPHYWSVNIGGSAYSGSIGSYDFRSYGSLLLAGTDTVVYHSPDGTFGLYSSAGWNDNDTYGELGDGSVGGWLNLTTLVVLPNTPTGLTATYVSDTQVNLAWSQTNASNGVPTSVRIESSINGGAWAEVVSLGNTTSATVATTANTKTEYRVRSGNAAGATAWSNIPAPVYTTPGAPSNANAVKNAAQDIVITFTENVNYNEHTHEVWHGTVTGGVTTWDGAALTTLASNVVTYTHVAPNASQVHTYRIRAKAGALVSGYANTGNVQLLAPPNAPTLPAMPTFVDKAAALVFNWTHNSIDTTPQRKYEVSYSTNGGGAWTSGGIQTSAASSYTVPANTYPANTALSFRVRTWGSATTGGADTTGASAWSDIKLVTYKTVPTASITTPANGSTINDSTIRVTVGFTQPEAATFVKTQLELLQGVTLLETLESAIQVGITLATPAQNGVSYTVRSRVQDSNGLWSAWVSSTFNTVYLPPVPAVVTTQYLPDTGWVQLNLTIAAPGGGQSAATSVSISRAINGVSEDLLFNFAVQPTMTILDTTPTIHGTNTYTITTRTALGAALSVTAIVVTDECRRAYLSKGDGFNTVVVFGGNLSVSESLSVASDTVQAAGRTKPIGLYGMETSVQVKVQSFMYEGFGSPIDSVRQILLVPGEACYRDASGRRVFGSVKGSVAYKKATRGDLSFTLTETS